MLVGQIVPVVSTKGGVFATSENIRVTTERHISEDMNPQPCQCRNSIRAK